MSSGPHPASCPVDAVGLFPIDSAKVENVWNYTMASSHVLMVFCLISADTHVIFHSLKLVLYHVKWLASLSSQLPLCFIG